MDFRSRSQPSGTSPSRTLDTTIYVTIFASRSEIGAELESTVPVLGSADLESDDGLILFAREARVSPSVKV